MLDGRDVCEVSATLKALVSTTIYPSCRGSIFYACGELVTVTDLGVQSYDARNGTALNNDLSLRFCELRYDMVALVVCIFVLLLASILRRGGSGGGGYALRM